MQTESILKTFILILIQIIVATCIIIISKYSFASSGINPFFLLFLRYFFSFIILLPIILPVFLSTYKEHKFNRSFRRTFVGISALAIWTYCYFHIPLTVATTFTFLIPIITIIIAEFHLRERVTKVHKVLLCSSFVGIVIAIHPAEIKLNIYYLISILACILWAFGNISRKVASSNIKLKVWLCYYSMWSMILTLIFALPFFSKIPLRLLPPLILLAILTATVNIISFEVYKRSNATFVQTFDFLRFVFIVIADVLIFDQQLTILTVVGSFVVIISSSLILFIEKSKHKKGSKIHKVEFKNFLP
jgi:drug/metabolite transporter (DMT)-like permease